MLFWPTLGTSLAVAASVNKCCNDLYRFHASLGIGEA